MWGWKTVERNVSPSISLDEARQQLSAEGFDEQSGDSHHTTFTRNGTRLTTKGEKINVELAIARSDTGLVTHLRYSAFVLFDTGDLEAFGDEIASLLHGNTTSQGSLV